MTGFFVIIASLIISVRSGSYAAWLWRNNEKLSSFGVWLVTFFMLVVSVAFRNM